MRTIVKAWMFVWIILVTGCSTVDQASVEYKVGDRGPAGGFIFYDDEDNGIDNIPNARYLEAAPKDLKGTYQWGLPDVYIGSKGSRIGSGITAATELIEANPKANYAAHACDRYRVNWHRDWFFPDRDMVGLIYTELKGKGLGGFSDGVYSSSGEDDEMYIEVVDFSNGGNVLSKKDAELKVRPVRAF